MSTALDSDEIIANLKAIIASNKEGVSLTNLANDYYNILGEHLPNQKLLEFIQSTEAFKIKNLRGNIMVYVESDEKTQHLAEIIKKPKATKMVQPVKSPLMNTQPVNIKSCKTIVYAQDRLKKYVKKNIDEVESSNNPSTKSPTYCPEQCNYKIHQNEVENKYMKTVILTSIHNPSNIWVILAHTKKNESFFEIQMELNDMEGGSQFEKSLVTGRNYVLFHQQKWQRIIIKNIDIGHNVKCFLIDKGVLLNVHRNDIYLLEPKYFNVCGQAFNITLNEFKSFVDFPFINDILNEILLNKKFALIPDNLLTSQSIVTLYDLETILNMKNMILNMFFEKANSSFCFNNINNVIEAELLSVDENGYWYLQKDTHLLKPLENIFLTDLFSTPHLKNGRDIDYTNTYLAPYIANIRGRVKVIHFVNNSQVKVFFIDYGVYKVVGVIDLIDLNKIDKRISYIPCQAVKVTLFMFPPRIITAEIEKMFFDILGNNNRVLVFYINDLPKNVPCVQLTSVLFPTTCLNMVMHLKIEMLRKVRATKTI